jgi:DNA-binding MarR family transcriptional regulator
MWRQDGKSDSPVTIYIVIRYNIQVAARIDAADYRALASLRYLIRGFLGQADAAACRAGLEPQQFQLMLAIRGLPEALEATVQVLAERLALKHNSTVELIDRMEKHGYVRRRHSEDDRRRVLISLRPQGERLLQQVARQRLIELRAEGAALLNAMDALLAPKRRPSRKTRRLRHFLTKTGRRPT